MEDIDYEIAVDNFKLLPLKAIVSSPVTSNKTLTKIYDDLIDDDRYIWASRVYIFAEMAKNPNCSKELFEKLVYTDSIENNIQINVLSNPKCPVNIMKDYLDGFLDNTYYDYASVIFDNPSCPQEIFDSAITSYLNGEASKLTFTDEIVAKIINKGSFSPEVYNKLVLLDKKIINNAIVKKANCPTDILVKLAFEELEPSVKDIENFDYSKYNKAFYYLFFKMLEKKNDNNLVSCNQLVKRIDKLIMNDNFPEEILYFYYKNSLFSSYFSQKSCDKIDKIGLNIDKIDSNGLTKKEKYSLIIKNDLSKVLGKKSDSLGNTNIYPYIDNVDLVDNKDDKTKVIIKCDSFKYIAEKAKDGIIEFGYYPQDDLSLTESAILDILYGNGQLEEGFKKYSYYSLFGKKDYKECLFNGRRFIKYNNNWKEIKPIRWIINKDNKTLITENDLFVSKANKNKIINSFMENVISDYKVDLNSDDKDAMKKFNKIEAEENFIKSMEEKEQEKEKNEEKRIRKNDLQLRELELMLELDKVKKEINSIEQTSERLLVNRVSLDLSSLLKKVNDHIEIDPKYIPYLKYIDLSLVESDNLKVSGIDFSETNISLDPQTVYNKDLSNSKFDDSNFTFKLFDGCNLSGSDLSNEKDSFGFENAIIDENTKIPINDAKTLNK